VFAPLLLLIFWIGFTPQPFLDRMQPALDRTLALSRRHPAQRQHKGPTSTAQGPVSTAACRAADAPDQIR